MMPEPSAGSKLPAEEFGIEYEEGAEGIDGPQIRVQDTEHERPAFASPAYASLPPSFSSTSSSFLTSSSSTSFPTSTSHQPVLERLASDDIRRINDTARDCEGLLCGLLERRPGHLDELDLPEPDDEPLARPPIAELDAASPQPEDSPVARPKPSARVLAGLGDGPGFRSAGDYAETTTTTGPCRIARRRAPSFGLASSSSHPHINI
ncbi:hypothetical protein B0H12DRAFT_1235036 [Mycena haematopus]|nr:hypothetical protein B0H12DRAFT_1235036 [Mycena haematopus]